MNYTLRPGEYVITNACSLCKKSDFPLSRLASVKTKKGIRVSLTCRPCNTERCGKYRATPKGGKNIQAAVYRSISKYPERQRARMKVSNALQTGKLVKTPCIFCGKVKVEGHHKDYSKPLMVVWLCRTHHADLECGKIQV